jgi:hypothetical protein
MDDTVPPGRLPPPGSLLVFDDFIRALADGRGYPFSIRRGAGPVRRVAPGTRLGQSIATGFLSRREAEVTLADWRAAMVEGASCPL